jgi:alkyl sulfatase BDS1-like metallo-beta-lactamase superfamily hydrolase
VLHPGDLFIWAVPNAGNPQKVQRFASDWAAALRQMAACSAEIMLCGHGLPIFGADRVRQALTDTADVLDTIEAQTLVLMNQGVPLDRVLHEVEIPERLRELPYLQPVYDHPQFLVRNVWRRYGGWYDGEPDNLLPAPRAEQASEWVTLAGGLERVLARARELAVLFDPSSTEAHEVRAEVYAERSAQQVSSMARNILGHAAHASRQHKRDLAGDYEY